MTYVEGFVLAVPTANKEAYRSHAAQAAPLFHEFGARRLVENWPDDVHVGKVTDFPRAVQQKDDEETLFSWIEYPDRAARDAANAKIMSDPRMEAMGCEMPFDGKRMIFGGFRAIVEEGSGRGSYIDGILIPLPDANRDAYLALAQEMAGKFLSHGAVRVVETLGDDVPDGKLTDFARAVALKEGETVVFSWIEWPDKATRMAGWGAMMADDSMAGRAMPFDGQRMIYGGFANIVDA